MFVASLLALSLCAVCLDSRVTIHRKQVAVTREIMRKWSAAMKRLRPREHATSVTERDEVREGARAVLPVGAFLPFTLLVAFAEHRSSSG